MEGINKWQGKLTNCKRCWIWVWNSAFSEANSKTAFFFWKGVCIDRCRNWKAFGKRGYSEFISTIFLRPKEDGTYRMILNLKRLNKFTKCHYFKMDSLQTVLQMLTPSCYMIACAYYCIYVKKKFPKYLEFQWNSKLYAYRACPNELCLLPRAFTKLLKPVFFLHSEKKGSNQQSILMIVSKTV